ncbi:hypothetical protein Y032_0001g352 [Ancylostoma ceylanicum]|uniref:Uncharacterized protein n=1 Tax=Ancylostoma ceylanicum TaxID=53326 RepID=A0A016W4T2_9BILA|nr:hypothetical protein Y032_0001g352 [Ancylostoma ceylanicum]
MKVDAGAQFDRQLAAQESTFSSPSSCVLASQSPEKVVLCPMKAMTHAPALPAHTLALSNFDLAYNANPRLLIWASNLR